MRAHHHAGASARLDTAFAQASAEKETHHANQPAKQLSTRQPRQRPTQKKQAKRTKGAHDTLSIDPVDGIEDIVPDEMPTEHEPLFELSEHHPRFGHRMASKRRRGKKGSGGYGVTDADASDDSVGEDDYSIGVDAENADMLAELVLCASADDSGGTENHEGTEEERRFGRMASLEADARAHPAMENHAKARKPHQGGNDALPGALPHRAATSLRPGAAGTFGRSPTSRQPAEPRADLEWAEAALGALVQRNLRDPSAMLHIPQLGGTASTPCTPSVAKVNVLPAASRVMQRFLAHQRIASAGAPQPAKARHEGYAITASERRATPRGVGGVSNRIEANTAPYAATVDAVRLRLIENGIAQGVKPIPHEKLGHEQMLFNLTVVLFHLALHTPRRHLQLGAVQARRSILNRRLTAAE